MWDSIQKILSFTGVTEKSVWQDVFISALLIPAVIYLGNKFLVWWNNKRPSRLVFKGYLKKNKDIFIFHSQMSGADNNWNINSDQKYITRYPLPLPTDHANLGIQKKFNIDPVLSEAEVECLTDVHNILGRVGKVKNIHFGNLISDWGIWSDPIFSIGFNPKTHKLIEKCNPVYFKLEGSELLIKDKNIRYGCLLPNDAGIIQKTSIINTSSPIFILAGLGTVGTSAAGYILKQNFIKIGKLFGSGAFCIFLKAKIDESKTSAFIDKIYPTPKWYRIILHPLLYYSFKRRAVFKYSD